MISSLQSKERANRSLRSRDAGRASAHIASACFILVARRNRPRVTPISRQLKAPLRQRRHYEAALPRSPLQHQSQIPGGVTPAAG